MMRLGEALVRVLRQTGRLVVPRNRSSWITAIENESSERGADQLDWAWGCFVTSIDLRLREDGGFWVALLLVALFSYVSVFLLMFGIDMSLGEQVLRDIGYAIDWGPIALGSAALTIWRQKRWIVTALALPIITQTVSLVSFTLYFHTPLSQILTIHIMDARIDVGLGAEIGYAFVGALSGLLVQEIRSSTKA